MAESKPDKFNVQKDGDRFKATVTRHFDTQEQASHWGDSVTVADTPEKAASAMTPAEAEEINANVVPAPTPASAETQPSGGGQPNDNQSGAGNGNRRAPHEMGTDKANDDK